MVHSILPLRPLLSPECVALGVEADARGVLAAAAELLASAHGVRASRILERLQKREQRASTALGWGVALPHADLSGLRGPAAAFLRTARPLPFGAPDGAPVSDILVLMVPRPATAIHFELLLHYRRLLVAQEFQQALRACADAPALWRLFQSHEPVAARNDAAWSPQPRTAGQRA